MRVVVVVVVIVVVGGAQAQLVEHHAQDRAAGVVDQAAHLVERVAGDLPRLGHQDRALDLRGHDDRIGQHDGRGRVEEDHVRQFLRPLDDAGHLLGLQQLGRVGRQRTGRHDAQARHVRLVDHIRQDRFTDQHVRQATVGGDVEDAVQAGTPQVGVNQQHFLPGLGEDRRQVGGSHGLALTGPGAGHQEGTGRMVHLRKVDVGAQRTVGLGRWALG